LYSELRELSFSEGGIITPPVSQRSWDEDRGSFDVSSLKERKRSWLVTGCQEDVEVQALEDLHQTKAWGADKIMRVEVAGVT
jgi:hypothetical protein